MNEAAAGIAGVFAIAVVVYAVIAFLIPIFLMVIMMRCGAILDELRALHETLAVRTRPKRPPPAPAPRASRPPPARRTPTLSEQIERVHEEAKREDERRSRLR